MKVSALTVDPLTSLPVMILVDESGEQTLPISIGLSEASQMATILDGIEVERPPTHTLLLSMLAAMHCRLSSVEIFDFYDGDRKSVV